MSVNTTCRLRITGAPGTSPNQPGTRRLTILIVDDRAINWDFLASLLNYSGYQAVEANSPTELPDVAHLDLIITDVHMPGMNGLDFLTALPGDAITRHVPVILQAPISVRVRSHTDHCGERARCRCHKRSRPQGWGTCVFPETDQNQGFPRNHTERARTSFRFAGGMNAGHGC